MMKQRSTRRKLTFWAIFFGFSILLFEFFFRVFFAISYGKASVVWRPFNALDHYYPGIIDELNKDLVKNDETFDLLILGGSVLTEQWGDILKELEVLAQDSLQNQVRFHNLATPAHTTRDSRLKYQLLMDKPYDGVFVYHGINSVRFNNCPDSVFNKEYNHVDFYMKVNTIATNPWSHYSILPLLYQTLKTNIFRAYAEEHFLPFHAPTKGSHKEWIAFGTDIKTAESFKENLTYIIDKAVEKRQFVFLSSFAYYIPNNYSFELFKKNALDYGRHRNPVELWGTVETVSKGLDMHNEVIKRIEKKYAESPYFFSVDENAELNKDKYTFDDLCHLTLKGSRDFAINLLPAIDSALHNYTSQEN